MQSERILRLLIARIDAIADAIRAYHHKRDSHERAHAQTNKVTMRVLVATASFAFLAAVSSLISSWIFHNQLNEMRTEQRAWLGPTRAYFASPPSEVNTPSVVIEYQNTGKTPALDVSLHLTPKNFASGKKGTLEESVVIKRLKNKCTSKAPTRYGFTAYPQMPYSVLLKRTRGLSG